MDYDALTFDTQVIETNSFHFDGGLLEQLKQFKDGQTQILVTLIVAAEISRHLRDKTQNAKDGIEAAHKRAQLYGLRNPEELAFAAAPDVETLARGRLQKYFDEIGATIIKPDDVQMRDLVHAYVSAAPPFARTGKKKNEFPDAIALLSLEHWAKTNGKRILAVSGDSDWAAFAEKSDHIDVATKLADALAKVQQDLDQADDIAQKLLAAIKSGTNADMADEFERLLRETVENTYPHTEGTSYYYWTPEGVDLTFNRYEIDEDGGYLPAQVVQVGRSKIVVDAELRVFIDAEASFSLETQDSVDGDYVGLGSTTANKYDEEEAVEVLITFEGDFESGEVDVTKVEVVKGLKSLEFGEIEPDFGEPDYEEMAAFPNADGEPAADEIPM